MEAAGIEPEREAPASCAMVGPAAASSGLDAAQLGHHLQLAPGTVCKGRTGAGPEASKAGLKASTTGAQSHPATGPLSPSRDEGLSLIVYAWDGLPGSFRDAIVGLIKACADLPRET